MRERHPCVYILASGCSGTLYVGVTSDMVSRICQHHDGVFDGFIRRYAVDRLVWFDAADTIASEKRIKRWRRDWKMNLIERTNPHWHDLAIGLGLPPLP